MFRSPSANESFRRTKPPANAIAISNRKPSRNNVLRHVSVRNTFWNQLWKDQYTQKSRVGKSYDTSLAIAICFDQRYNVSNPCLTGRKPRVATHI